MVWEGLGGPGARWWVCVGKVGFGMWALVQLGGCRGLPHTKRKRAMA